MKRLFITPVLLVFPYMASSQLSIRHEIDTLTAGDSEERNPSMQHNSFEGPATKWLVFERTVGGLTSISGIQLDGNSPAWHTDVVQISDVLPSGEVRFPDVAGMSFSPTSLRVAAWEQRTAQAWNVWYSTRSDTDSAWTNPRPLTQDTVDNTGIQLRPSPDRYVFATWRRGRDLVGCGLRPEGRADTLLIGSSTLDGFDFDVNPFTSSGMAFVWVTEDSSGKHVLAFRTMDYSYPPQPNWQPIQIFSFPFSVGNPWLAAAWRPGGSIIALEGRTDSKKGVLVSYNGSIDNVTADTSADYGNPTGIYNPVLTDKTPNEAFQGQTIVGDVFVVERRGSWDSSLVFWPGWPGFSDTVKGPGQNRNVVVGSPRHIGCPADWYPVVWESNRTGRWHLYGTLALVFTDDIRDDWVAPSKSSLLQNYPNPFNPSTNISYQLPVAKHVKLVVFDVLGREVATLVDGVEEPGYKSVMWDASGVASGVYFYRLQAGDFVQTRKLLLLR
jgi:hypothetical protein